MSAWPSPKIPLPYLQAASWEEAPLPVPEHLRKNKKLYRVQPPDNNSLFTGYYEPVLEASLTREGPYQYPLYRAPDDLLHLPNTPESGQTGRFAWGRMQNGKLVPHVTRAEVHAGALDGKNLELFYAKDPVELFFLHVQGSGKIALPDGSFRRVGFAGKSGHAYSSIGKILREEEKLNPAAMENIKAWLRANPERLHDTLNRNASFIFFKFLEGEGPIGVSGAVLHPEASLAIDDTIWPYGLDVIVETRDPLDPGKPFIRLMKTADTGSAIRGVARGDIFFGSGTEAGQKAGVMQHSGQLWIILPVEQIAITPSE